MNQQPTTSLPFVPNPLEMQKLDNLIQPNYVPYPQQPYVMPAVYSPQAPPFNPYMAAPYAAQPSQAYYLPPPQHVSPVPNTVTNFLNTRATLPREYHKWQVLVKLLSIIQLIFALWLFLLTGFNFVFLLYIPSAVCGILGSAKLNKPLLFTYAGLQSFLMLMQIILTIFVIAYAASEKLTNSRDTIFYILFFMFCHVITGLSIFSAWKVIKNIQVTLHTPATELQNFGDMNSANLQYPAQNAQLSQPTQIVQTPGAPVPYGVQTSYAPIVMQEMTETQANLLPNELGIDKPSSFTERENLLINV